MRTPLPGPDVAVDSAAIVHNSRTISANQRLADLALRSWPIRPLLPRMVELSRNLTTYVAAYVALAEHLAVPLVTPDRKVKVAPGRCRVLTPPVE